MSSFGSSVINTGKKKLAPKAPIRRRPAAAGSQPASAKPAASSDATATATASDSQNQAPTPSAPATAAASPPPASASPAVTVAPPTRVTAPSATIQNVSETQTHLPSPPPTQVHESSPASPAAPPHTTDTNSKQTNGSAGAGQVAEMGATKRAASDTEATAAQAESSVVASAQDGERSPKRRRVGGPTVPSIRSRGAAQAATVSAETLTPLPTAESTPLTSPQPTPSSLPSNDNDATGAATVATAATAATQVEPATATEAANESLFVPLEPSSSVANAPATISGRTRKGKQQATAETTKRKSAAVARAVKQAAGRNTRATAASNASENVDPVLSQNNGLGDASGDAAATPAVDNQSAPAKRKRQTRAAKEPAEVGKAESPRKRQRSTPTKPDASGATIIQQHVPGVVIENGIARKPRKPRSDKGIPKKSSTPRSVEPEDGSSTGVDAAGMPIQSPAPPSSSSTMAPSDTIGPNITHMGTPDAAEDEDDTTKKRRGRQPRQPTPEANEDIIIDTGTVMMNELTRDARRGRLSQREKDMRKINWDDVLARRRAAQWKDPRADATPQEEPEASGADTRAASSSSAAPGTSSAPPVTGGEHITYVLRKGVMVLDTESTAVDRRRRQQQQQDDMEEIEENDLERRITNQTWRHVNAKTAEDRIPALRRGKRWSDEDTDAFYDALRMFGTDFFIISKMFAGRTRRHIKSKFVMEEKVDPDRIKAALTKENVPMDFAHFLEKSHLREEDFRDPEVVARELKLEEQEKRKEVEQARLEAEENARQKQTHEEMGKEKKKRERKKKKGQVIGGEEVEVVEEGAF